MEAYFYFCTSYAKNTGESKRMADGKKYSFVESTEDGEPLTPPNTTSELVGVRKGLRVDEDCLIRFGIRRAKI